MIPRFYELILILRQDTSSTELDRIINELINLLTQNNQAVVQKNEYWGLKNLAYMIKKDKKGHYIFLGLEVNDVSVLTELKRNIRLNDIIIRDILIKVKELKETPSDMLKETNPDINAINVTKQEPKYHQSHNSTKHHETRHHDRDARQRHNTEHGEN